MSDNDAGDDSDTQILTAEYKDGRLQIIDMPSLDDEEDGSNEMCSASSNHKLMQVLDRDKGLVQLDMLNFTLVRYQDNNGEENTYHLLTNAECEGDDSNSVTCVLQGVDGLAHSSTSTPKKSKMRAEAQIHPGEGATSPSYPETYVMLDSSQDDDDEDMTLPDGVNLQVHQAPREAESNPPQLTHVPVVHDHSAPVQCNSNEDKIKKLSTLSPAELLQRAKALRLSKAAKFRRRGLPPPHELLASPNFKLFLYSCKQCNYKCNAIKELTAHRLSAHSSRTRPRGGALSGRRSPYRAPQPQLSTHASQTRSRGGSFQCARCPYRALQPQQLTRHVEEMHCSENMVAVDKLVTLDSQEVADADVLVCGACGFETGHTDEFRRHITSVHM